MSARTMNNFAAHPRPGDCRPRVITPIPKASTSLESDHEASTSNASVQQEQQKTRLPSFWLCNARSANNKFEELLATVTLGDFDVCALTETWYKHDILPGVVSIPGYSLFMKCRQHQLGGGVALYVKHQWNASQLPEIDVPENLEIRLDQARPYRLPRSVSCIFCAVAYFPHPDSEVEEAMIDHMLSTIDHLSVSNPQAGFVILGDFNQLNINPLIADQNFRQVVDQPTRGNNVLDKIITNVSDKYAIPQITSPVGMSDHNTVHWAPVYSPQIRNASKLCSRRPMPESAECYTFLWNVDQ